MKRAVLALFGAILSATQPAHALVEFSSEHLDFATNYNAALGQWLLTLRDEDNRVEYAGRVGSDADRVVIRGGLSARIDVPDDSRFTFLGAPGSSIFVLPQTQDPDLPFVGVSTENKTSQIDWMGDGVSSDFLARGISSGTFTGNQVTLTLTAFSGPGQFFLYSTNTFGNPVIVANTTDGLSSADSRFFSPGVHSHFNWAFTSAGDYDLTFVASGTLSAGGALSQSAATSFRFSIVPEPASAALVALGSLLLARPRRPPLHPSHTP